jgi:hypothetical protein
MGASSVSTKNGIAPTQLGKVFFVKVSLTQRLLNQMPGIYVREDGLAGRKTSDAYREVTGYYLNGDPRTKGLAVSLRLWRRRYRSLRLFELGCP